MYAGIFGAGESATLPLAKGRGAWVHVARGKARVGGRELADGDGAAIEVEDVRVEGVEGGGEVLVFDLA